MVYPIFVVLPRWQITGPALFAERLVRGLQKQGRDVHLLLTGPPSERDGSSWFEAPLPDGLPYSRLPGSRDDTWGQRWLALERYLEERAPCFFVMLHDWDNNIIASRLSSRVYVIDIVQEGSRIEIKQAERLGQHCRAIVATSDLIHFELLYRLPQFAHKIHMIPKGVPALRRPPMKPEDGPLLIGCSGGYHPQGSHLDELSEISRRLTNRGIYFELTFYRQDSYQTDIEDKIREMLEMGLVSRTGRLSSEALLSDLETQHVFLLTSEFEGSSDLMLKAMGRACVPVISEHVAHTSVIRSGLDGLSARIGEIDEFVQHIERLANDTNERLRLSKAAFSRIQADGYRVEDMVDGYLALFNRIMAASTGSDCPHPRSSMLAPKGLAGGNSAAIEEYTREISYVNRFCCWPDPPPNPSFPLGPQPKTIRPHSDATLEGYRVLVSASAELISGVDVFAVHLVRGLRQRGFDARVLVFEENPYVKPVSEVKGLPIVDIRKPNYLGWPEHWRRVIHKLSELAPAVYIPNFDYKNSCVSPQLPAAVRTIGIGHSDDPTHYEHLCRIGHACDAIVGVSTAITRHMASLAPHFTSRLVTIPYGITLPESPSAEQSQPRQPAAGRALRVVFIGRLERSQKRAGDVVAIAKALHSRDVLYELVVIGDGELRSSMEQETIDLMIERKIWFTRSQPNAVALKFLDTCDVFLLPSSFEGLSVAMLEAMSRGVVPVVSAIRSGVPDVIVDGVNGLVAPVGDIEAFADRIEWFVNNPSDLQRMSAAAISTVRDGFSADLMLDRYIELFRQLVAKPSERIQGPIVPPQYIAEDLKFSTWARRIAADPLASLRRVHQRLMSKRPDG